MIIFTARGRLSTFYTLVCEMYHVDEIRVEIVGEMIPEDIASGKYFD